MHPQLTILLEIQDLRAQQRELAADSAEEELERTQFKMDPAEAAESLGERIEVLEEELTGSIRARYNRISRSLDRVVVPVIRGLCYGCFVAIPTATAREQEPNQSLQGCEHCGRFIYILS
ncbi:MAG: hypothetical protein WEA09_00495 [Gemmatimonadota bacterium]